MRIGYLVPEFPAQTHIFFWREMKELRRQGIEPLLLSTSPPPSSLASHAWSKEAAEQTEYLVPQSVSDWIVAAGEALAAYHWRTPALLTEIARSTNSIKTKVKLVAAAIAGARLARNLRASRCTHVHAHSAAMSADVAMYAARLNNCTFSLTLHGPLHDYGGNQQAKWSSAAFGIVITQLLKQELLSKISVDERKLSVVAMGVDVAKLRRRNPYRAFDGSGDFKVFSCGRLNYIKGHQELIQAVFNLRASGVAVKLVIAGEDEQGGTGFRRTLETQIRDLDLNDVVTLRGALAEEDVLAELENAHCFALASHSEPLGVAIMEAMAMETPTVTTSGGGVPELITSADQAIMVQPKNVAELQAALLSVRDDQHLASKLSAAGAARVREAFGSDASARVLVERLKEIGVA